MIERDGTTGSADAVRVGRADRLTPAEVTEVLDLAGTATSADGAAPLAEHVLLRLRHPGAPATHLTVRDPAGTLTGYAHLDLSAPGQGVPLELAVHPAHRHRGVGRALVETALAASPGRLHAWAHGDHPSAAALAVDLGFTRTRLLWQLRRPLGADLPDPVLPDGVALRAFAPGVDDAAWLALNARAFADHPEQGRFDQEDLRVRMAEPWFDPAGFLLAVEASTGRLLGFHWTKIHGPDPAAGAGATHRPAAGRIGEVYVLGVDPDAHRGGLGRALTSAGLAYLRAQGLDRVMLYVDDENARAVALYERLGFARWTAHVVYQS
ncbi:mycothiol synthase [Micromonospora echinofusca]|uniref:Mycothiol acetyltransferase n=1 Tax=Micromonospora echinofusca TaxID=47858 RepID=A0ABS3VV76_MICEH|nr:mycothiol synthase [Micromonospora echinofusca]MBO4208293.1 mycothiol synthase [Micromonospora echinofusca]